MDANQLSGIGETNRVYKTGVIGYGLSAKIFHIPFIQDSKHFSLHAVVQRSPKPEDDAEKDHPGIKSYRSTEDLVKDKDVDVVVVTTTPETHHDLAILCMKAKKHVVVEKPFTPTSAEAEALVKVAKQEGVFLTVYQNRRYDADFVTLSSLLKEGKLGRIAEFETHFDRHRPEVPTTKTWKTDPSTYSATFDLGTHLIDQVVSLYGLPNRITGFVGTQRGSANTTGLEDSFTCLLHYDDATTDSSGEHGSLLVTAKAGVVSPEQEQLRFWIKGTKGSFKKYHLDPQEDQLKAGLRPGKEEYGKENEARWGVLSTADSMGSTEQRRVEPVNNGGYTSFYDQFAGAMDAGDERLVPTSGEVAAQVIRLIELMRDSSKQWKTLTV